MRIPFGYGQKSFGSEGSFGVNEQTLALSPAHVYRQLAINSQSVTQLRFACTELPEYFRDGSSFNTSYYILLTDTKFTLKLTFVQTTQ